MGLVLNKNMHFCIANGRTAFLDLYADRFFGLPDPVDAAFQRLVSSGEPSEMDLAFLQTLLKNGMLIADEGNVFRPAPLHIDVPNAPAPIPLHSRPKVGLWLFAIVSQIWAGFALRSRSLQSVLQRVRSSKERQAAFHCQGAQSLAEAVRAFGDTGLLIRSEGKCLRVSLAMTHYLRQLGFAATLVLGVRMAPFAAHAWVQNGEHVLSDDPGNVRRYTPIAAF